MTEAERKSSARIWQILWVLGLVLFVAGTIDVALGIYPLDVGTPEWEFAAVANFLNRLPLAAVGLGMALAAALARGRTVTSVVAAVALLLMATTVAMLTVLFLTSLPVVIQGQTGTARTALLRGAGKGAVQGLVYTFGFAGVAVYAVRGALRLRRVV